MKKIVTIALLSTVLLSCAGKRNLVYFSNLAKHHEVANLSQQAITVQQDDLLRISVNSLSQESNLLFAINNQNGSSKNIDEQTGYRVNQNGEINYPVIGTVKVIGLTTSEVQSLLAAQLDRYVKKPIVDVRVINFKVTVIGEVNRPGTFNVQGDRINLLEALGLAGDMTVYGKRHNVLVIREQNGQRIMKRVNLNEPDVMNSVFFTLKQNDMVYVEPDKSKATEFSANTRLMPIVIASISAVAVLINAILNK